jgi:hypothetical protein
MSNYQAEQSYKVNKIELTVHPYVAAPDDLFDTAAALQYGADFKVRFSRGGAPQNTIGLIQLIFPQTNVFEHTKRVCEKIYGGASRRSIS